MVDGPCVRGGGRGPAGASAEVDSKVGHGPTLMLGPEIVHLLDIAKLSPQRRRWWIPGRGDVKGAGVGVDLVSGPERELRFAIRFGRQKRCRMVWEIERDQAGLTVVMTDQRFGLISLARALHVVGKIPPALGPANRIQS